jgi:hypothetical protein
VWNGTSERFGREVKIQGLEDGTGGCVTCVGKLSVSLAKSTQKTSLYIYQRRPPLTAKVLIEEPTKKRIKIQSDVQT